MSIRVIRERLCDHVPAWWASRSPSAMPIGIAFFVQGTCAAMMLGTSTAMLTSAYPPGERFALCSASTRPQSTSACRSGHSSAA